jgi:hypothetical protein
VRVTGGCSGPRVLNKVLKCSTYCGARETTWCRDRPENSKQVLVTKTDFIIFLRYASTLLLCYPSRRLSLPLTSSALSRAVAPESVPATRRVRPTSHAVVAGAALNYNSSSSQRRTRAAVIYTAWYVMVRVCKLNNYTGEYINDKMSYKTKKWKPPSKKERRGRNPTRGLSPRIRKACHSISTALLQGIAKIEGVSTMKSSRKTSRNSRRTFPQKRRREK